MDIYISYFLTFIALCMIVRPWASWVLATSVQALAGLSLVFEFVLGMLLLLVSMYIRNW